MRIYLKNNKKYLSVTSVLELMSPFDSSSFTAWCYKNGFTPEWINQESTRIGSKIHEWAENRARGIEWADEAPDNEKEKKYLEAVDKFSRENKVVKNEFEVFCDELKYAGRCDGMLDDGTLIDFKSWGSWKGKYKRDPKKIKKAGLQLSMYNYAMGNRKPAKVFVFKPEGDYDVEVTEYNHEFADWIKNNEAKITKILDDNKVGDDQGPENVQ